MAFSRKDIGLSRKTIVMLSVLIFGSFVAVLNQTVVTPAMASIMTEMGVTAAIVQWLTTGFMLVNAIMIPITAYLTDRFSTRTLFLASMCVFLMGTLLAAWGPTFLVLLLGRLVQAMGAGILFPMVMIVIMQSVPLANRGTAMGVYGLVIAFAPAIGPTLAGVIIDHASWHFMFVIIAVLAVVVIVLSFFVLEHTEPRHGDLILDKLSVFLSTLGFGGLLYGCSVIGSEGIGIEAGVVAVVGAVAIVLFFRRQLRLESPMLQVRVLGNRTFLVGTLINMIVQASLIVVGVLVPIYVQSLRGFSATSSGLLILPGAVIMGIMGPISGRIFDRHGPRRQAILGISLLVAATFAFAFIGDGTDLVYLATLYAVRMFGLALVNMPITTWAVNALDDSLVNHGTSVNNTFRQVAGSLGTATLVSVMTAVANSQSTAMDYVHANIFGIDCAFAVAACLALVGLVLTILFVRDRPAETEVDSDGAAHS